MLVDRFTAGMTERGLEDGVVVNRHLHAPRLLEPGRHRDFVTEHLVWFNLGLHGRRHGKPGALLATATPDRFRAAEHRNIDFTIGDAASDGVQVRLWGVPTVRCPRRARIGCANGIGDQATGIGVSPCALDDADVLQLRH